MKNIENTVKLLSLFGNHRIHYEATDLYDLYFAYFLIPGLTLLGIFLAVYFGVFSLPSFQANLFFGLSFSVILLWCYLCFSDPGRVIDMQGQLRRIPGLNQLSRQAYQDSIHGKKVVNQSLCATCEIERPTRCKHCSKCDVCVMKMDHHCRFSFIHLLFETL